MSKFSVSQFSVTICMKLHVMLSLKFKLVKLQFTVSVQLCSHAQLCFPVMFSAMYAKYDNEKRSMVYFMFMHSLLFTKH